MDRKKWQQKVLELAEDYVTLSPRAARCLQQDILDLFEDVWEEGYQAGVESQINGHYEAMNAAEYD